MDSSQYQTGYEVPEELMRMESPSGGSEVASSGCSCCRSDFDGEAGGHEFTSAQPSPHPEEYQQLSSEVSSEFDAEQEWSRAWFLSPMFPIGELDVASSVEEVKTILTVSTKGSCKSPDLSSDAANVEVLSRRISSGELLSRVGLNDLTRDKIMAMRDKNGIEYWKLVKAEGSSEPKLDNPVEGISPGAQRETRQEVQVSSDRWWAVPDTGALGDRV